MIDISELAAGACPGIAVVLLELVAWALGMEFVGLRVVCPAWMVLAGHSLLGGFVVSLACTWRTDQRSLR